ncbi:MAG: acyl-CoA dehydrogenase, partial [Acidimicrobiia bacterium]
MSIALSDDHVALADVVRSFLAERGALRASRDLLDAKAESLPGFWPEIADLGWTGIHLPETYGGQGYGIAELAVIAEEFGRTAAPGPFIPTVIASAVIDSAGTEAQKAALLPGLAAGTVIASIATRGGVTLSGASLTGTARAVPAGTLAQLLLVIAGDDVAVVSIEGLSVDGGGTEALDLSRRGVDIRLDGITAAHVLPGAARVANRIVRTILSAEAAGGARTCTEAAVAYAKDRVQFGRPIATFQAVKHHCANMLAATEMACAAAWDAARAPDDEADLAAAIAGSMAIGAYTLCARLSIQLHGGIAFTWEHDAHLFLRRAAAIAALCDEGEAKRDAALLTIGGARRSVAIDLPAEADTYRAEVRAFNAAYEAASEADKHELLLASGYLAPHYPKPWGRGADPIEQLVIDSELTEVPELEIGVGKWILPALAQCGNDDQRERWMWPAMRGDIKFCQLFSEPNAGSDAAAIRTKGVKVDGGWLITGQKVWTSDAHNCSHGEITVRTDPDAPKHKGVTMMVIDMHAPGVEVRPLREITGEAMFNEVFFDEAFVPDEDVVGEVGGGWAVARATLGFERFTIGGQSGEGLGVTAW